MKGKEKQQVLMREGGLFLEGRMVRGNGVEYVQQEGGWIILTIPSSIMTA